MYVFVRCFCVYVFLYGLSLYYVFVSFYSSLFFLSFIIGLVFCMYVCIVFVLYVFSSFFLYIQFVRFSVRYFTMCFVI